MADLCRERHAAGYYKQLAQVTAEFLEPQRKRRIAAARGPLYEVERIISMRSVAGNVR